MTGSHVFVDESKGREFLLVAAVVLPGDVTVARRAVSNLTLPRQSGVHMVRESDARRKQILSTVRALDPRVTVYLAPKDGRTELARREVALRALVADSAAAGHAHLCLDRDDTLVERDRRQLYDAVRAVGAEGTLRYRHAKTVTEPLLVVPDAVAWACSKGGARRALTAGVVVRVVDL